MMKKYFSIVVILIVAVSSLLFTRSTMNLDDSKNIIGKTSSGEVAAIDKTALNDKTIEFDTIDLEGKIVAGKVDSNNDFVKILKDVDELNKDSQYIIKGEVIDVEFFDYKGYGMSSTTVRIDESFKGDLNVNDVISVVESSGVTTIQHLIDYYGPEKFYNMKDEYINNGIVYNYNSGAPISEVGQKVYMFLMPAYFYEGAYECIGDFMGKYTLVGDEYVRHSPHDQFYGVPNDNPILRPNESTISQDIKQSVDELLK